MITRLIKNWNNCRAVIGWWKGSLVICLNIAYKVFRFCSPIAFFFLSLKHKIIFSYIRKLDKSEDIPVMLPKKYVNPKTIWMFWWQGEESMPELVKACIHSVKQHSGEYQVQLLTKDNITDFLDIPILSKVGIAITLVNFSDYVRLSLLSVYGGGWIDATIFLTKDIPNDFITNVGFYTIRHPRKRFFCVSDFRWGVSFLFAEKGNELIARVRDLFVLYWKRNNHLLDYFLIDYCFAYVVETDKVCRQILEKVPYNNPLAYFGGIADNLAQPFEVELYESIVKDTWIHKLSYKVPYESSEIQPTFYDFVLSGGNHNQLSNIVYKK